MWYECQCWGTVCCSPCTGNFIFKNDQQWGPIIELFFLALFYSFDPIYKLIIVFVPHKLLMSYLKRCLFSHYLYQSSLNRNINVKFTFEFFVYRSLFRFFGWTWKNICQCNVFHLWNFFRFFLFFYHSLTKMSKEYWEVSTPIKKNMYHFCPPHFICIQKSSLNISPITRFLSILTYLTLFLKNVWTTK